MQLLRSLVVLFGVAFTAACAKADTIQFIATVTSYNGLSVVPIGSTYTGFIHFAGSFAPDSHDFPPPVDSYGFTYPSAPVSINDLFWVFIEHDSYIGPVKAGIAYVDPSTAAGSFDINASIFTILTPTQEDADGFGYSKYESGTVTYSYLSDPPISSTPEPMPVILVGSGLVLAFALRHRNRLTISN